MLNGEEIDVVIDDMATTINKAIEEYNLVNN